MHFLIEEGFIALMKDWMLKYDFDLEALVEILESVLNILDKVQYF